MPGRQKTTMRSLGEFFGHIWKGVSTDPSPTKRIEVARKVQEAVRETPDGPVKLRRTTVDEVEVPNPGAVNKPLRG